MKVKSIPILFVIWLTPLILLANNLSTDLGNNEFLISVGENNILKVSELLNSKIEINYKNKLGLSAVRIAVENDYPQMLSLLLKKGAIFDDTSKFIHALFSKDVTSCERLLINGVSPNIIIYKEQYDSFLFKTEIDYPILFATRSKNVELLKLLIKYGANTNLASDETALMIAVKQNCVLDILKLLLDNDADIDKSVLFVDESTSGSALFYSIESNNLKSARFLLENKANTEIESYNSTTYNSFTPLMLAVVNDNIEAVQLLIEFSADINYINCRGENILSSTQNETIKMKLVNAKTK